MNRMITKFVKFIKESAYVDYFGVLYENAPKKLREVVDSTKGVEQSKEWHPEGDVYKHIRLVTNRLGNAYPNDKNLLLAGFFHDLGKVETTEWNEDKQSWTARGHEDVSSKIVDFFSSWIEEMGADVEIVKNIVDNHMRVKYLDEFKIQTRMEFMNNPHYEEVIKFNSCDYGGTGLEPKPLQDLTEVRKEIDEYVKLQEENKLINNKFNGNLIMNVYPYLKGKELGDKITAFKEYIFNEFNINFRKFVLDNDKDEIFNIFNKFIEEQDQGGIVQ